MNWFFLNFWKRKKDFIIGQFGWFVNLLNIVLNLFEVLFNYDWLFQIITVEPSSFSLRKTSSISFGRKKLKRPQKIDGFILKYICL